MKERSAYGSCVVHAEVGPGQWGKCESNPGVVRPTHCPKCARPAWLGDGRIRIVFHGRRARRVLGPRSASAAGGTVSVLTGLRFRCDLDGCGAVMFVVPREVAPRLHYSAPAVAFALASWAGLGLTAGAVRGAVAPPGRGSSAGWRQLPRWAHDIAAGRLFRGVTASPSRHAEQPLSAAVIAQVLAGRAPPWARQGGIAVQAFAGAAHHH